MKRKYYKITISETGANSPRNSLTYSELFNQTTKEFKTVKKAIAFLKDRYGEKFTFKRKRAMYVDIGDEVKQVGIIYSYWNKDISHNSKAYFQTDWISLRKIEEESCPVLSIED